MYVHDPHMRGQQECLEPPLLANTVRHSPAGNRSTRFEYFYDVKIDSITWGNEAQRSQGFRASRRKPVAARGVWRRGGGDHQSGCHDTDQNSPVSSSRR